MAFIALAVSLDGGGRPFYAHRRVGREGRPFLCLKFRTMAVDADARLSELLAGDPAARREWAGSQKLRDDPRVTRVGRLLRRSSLDELPQLFNVVRGDMRLVGPRPIVEGEIGRYGRRFRDYASVHPGITGLWQISGRNDTSYRTRVALDCVYARRRGPLLDLALLCRTVPAVLLRKGSY